MSAPGPTLKEIHRLRTLVKDLERRIEEGPRALKSHQLALARAEQGVQTGHDDIKMLKVSIHEKEVSVKASQQQIAKLEKTDITNKKEYDALRAEIAQAQAHIRTLEDEILEVMGAVEEKSKKQPETDKVLNKAKEDLARFERDHQEKLARYAQERASALEKIAATEQELEELTLAQYQRMIEVRGIEALSGVTGRTCVACFTDVTAQMSNDINRGLFVICKNCGRMLYRAD